MAKKIRATLDHWITMVGVLFARMKSNDKWLDDLKDLLKFNRIFAAHNLLKDVAFAMRWSRLIDGKGPPERSVSIDEVMSW